MELVFKEDTRSISDDCLSQSDECQIQGEELAQMSLNLVWWVDEVATGRGDAIQVVLTLSITNDDVLAQVDGIIRLAPGVDALDLQSQFEKVAELADKLSIFLREWDNLSSFHDYLILYGCAAENEEFGCRYFFVTIIMLLIKMIDSISTSAFGLICLYGSIKNSSFLACGI